MATGKDGIVFFINENGLKLTDITKEDVINHTVQDIVDRGIFSTSPTEEALRTKKPVFRFLKLKSSKSPNIMAMAKPFLDENGDVEMVVAYSQDVNFAQSFLDKIQEERNNAQEVLNYLQDSNQKNAALIFESKVMQDIFSFARKVAHADSTVMLYGESGTGKEVVARYIHKNSPRSRQAFIPINCAAIPAELMESEFFGYVSGAFTGARKEGKPGIFELANNGTLFLDELGEFPLRLQSKLLRVLETGEIQRLGSKERVATNTRIIAATNRDLEKMMGSGEFRKDLFYRLNVIPLTIPPIRERRDDIAPLALSFLREYNRKYGFAKYFSPETLKAMQNYDWPGNVREIRNLVERLVITSSSDMLAIELEAGANYNIHNYKWSEDAAPPTEPFLDNSADSEGSLKEAMHIFEERYIYKVLEECNGDINRSVKKLGIHRSGLYRKLSEYKTQAIQDRINGINHTSNPQNDK